jgi:NADPH-dependent 2,4-dienoyl-CoA reductase/sulfur reductase-like enzyme/peroxiredoxin family protein/TusA-related sulfurtransferase/rhodanese-related sulfurtransferase
MAENRRVVIVGGVAGGASAAARVRRLSETAKITMFERGRDISFANCGMPYHIGGRIAERERLLVQTPEAMRKQYNIDVRTGCEVVSIQRDAKTVTVREVDSGRRFEEPYDALILSPGAEPFRPPIPGADSKRVFTLRSLEDMDRIQAAVGSTQNRRAVVIGGGYIGLEMTEALRQRGLEVTLVELARQVFVAADPEMAAPLHRQLEMHGVDLRLGTSVASIAEKDETLELRLNNGETLECGIVILSVGVRPEVKLAREAGLAIGPAGGIEVDAHMRTTDPNIYAVGDAVEVVHYVGGQKVLLPLAGPANRQGRIAADNAMGRPSIYKNSQGTAICKVFDVAIGMTGLSETQLRKLGRHYEKVYVHPASHAGYYPGASRISLKLLFDPQNGKVLGAQAVGADGVDKRIDLAAMAIRAGLTVEDLAEQELCYAPPYGSAKDPINYAGFVASNVMSGDMPICHAADIVSLRSDQYLLDVRTPAEVQAGTIPGAGNIPLDELRGRLGELPAGKEVLVFCAVGLRGYLACRILQQHGIACRNLSGGYLTYKDVIGIDKLEDQPQSQMRNDTGKKGPMEATMQTESGGAGSVKTIDARSLQCPGPIMRLKNELEGLQEGQAVTILAADPGFPADVRGWCRATGNMLVESSRDNGVFRAVVRKGSVPAAKADRSAMQSVSTDKTMVVFSGDFDKAMAAFIIANGAAAMGHKVTLFFTFWGLNILRKRDRVTVRKNLIERMFGWMMPRGADKLRLSKMNMGGMGTAMIKRIMRRKNVASLPELIAGAQAAGVRLVACAMSMDLMGIRREELIDGVEEGGVAAYLDSAGRGNVNLFI